MAGVVPGLEADTCATANWLGMHAEPGISPMSHEPTFQPMPSPMTSRIDVCYPGFGRPPPLPDEPTARSNGRVRVAFLSAAWNIDLRAGKTGTTKRAGRIRQYIVPFRRGPDLDENRTST